jgi:hypothetical protein
MARAGSWSWEQQKDILCHYACVTQADNTKEPRRPFRPAADYHSDNLRDNVNELS